MKKTVGMTAFMLLLGMWNIEETQSNPLSSKYEEAANMKGQKVMPKWDTSSKNEYVVKENTGDKEISNGDK